MNLLVQTLPQLSVEADSFFECLWSVSIHQNVFEFK